MEQNFDQKKSASDQKILSPSGAPLCRFITWRVSLNPENSCPRARGVVGHVQYIVSSPLGHARKRTIEGEKAKVAAASHLRPSLGGGKGKRERESIYIYTYVCSRHITELEAASLQLHPPLPHHTVDASRMHASLRCDSPSRVRMYAWVMDRRVTLARSAKRTWMDPKLHGCPAPAHNGASRKNVYVCMQMRDTKRMKDPKEITIFRMMIDILSSTAFSISRSRLLMWVLLSSSDCWCVYRILARRYILELFSTKLLGCIIYLSVLERNRIVKMFPKRKWNFSCIFLHKMHGFFFYLEDLFFSDAIEWGDFTERYVKKRIYYTTIRWDLFFKSSPLIRREKSVGYLLEGKKSKAEKP